MLNESIEFTPLSPSSFFSIKVPCYSYTGSLSDFPPTKKNSYLLPDTSTLFSEEKFADLSMGWSAKGLFFSFEVKKPYEQGHYPDLKRGDSIEFFLDTRDVKTSGFNTRFCHHFYFLPKPLEEHFFGEITRFRTEDSHPLSDAQDLVVEPIFKKNHYLMKIFVPSHCLYGYDPDQFNRLGFTYRVNRLGGEPQHFSVGTSDYTIEQQPSLWGTLVLEK